MSMKKLFSLMVAVFLTGDAFTSVAQAEVSVGDLMPDFQLVGSDGKTYSSKMMMGETAYVIAWFPKAFTGGCTKECKSMRVW